MPGSWFSSPFTSCVFPTHPQPDYKLFESGTLPNALAYDLTHSNSFNLFTHLVNLWIPTMDKHLELESQHTQEPQVIEYDWSRDFPGGNDMKDLEWVAWVSSDYCSSLRVSWLEFRLPLPALMNLPSLACLMSRALSLLFPMEDQLEAQQRQTSPETRQRLKRSS